MATLLCELPRLCHSPGRLSNRLLGGAWRRPRRLLGSARHDAHHPEHPRTQAGRLARLPGRRPGVGRRHHRLRRPHEGAARHQHRGRERSGPAAHPRHRRGADRHAFAQGARGQRAHAGEPRGAARAASRPPGWEGGLGIYDVSDPAQPREITFWKCGGAGVHRFTFDGRYAYISPEMDGYVGNIVMILDLARPGPPGGGRPLVDAGAVDRPAARRRRGRARTTAATIRSASATGST